MEISKIFNSKCDTIDSLIYIFGSDKFLADKAVDFFLTSDEIGFKELNVTRMTDKMIEYEELRKLVIVPPIGSLKRIFIINYDCISEREQDKYTELFLTLPEFTSIIICNNGSKSESKSALIKLLLKRAISIRCSFNNNDEIIGFITGVFNDYNKKISSSDALYLYNYVQPDFNTLYNEIIKLCSLENDRITSRDIDLYCNRAEDYKIYLLHNYLVNKNIPLAKDLLDSIVKNESVIALISYLSTNFEILLMAKSCINARYSDRKTLDVIMKNYNGRYEYRIKNLIKQTNRFELNEIRNALRRLSDLDYLSKHNNYFLNESFFGELCDIYKI